MNTLYYVALVIRLKLWDFKNETPVFSVFFFSLVLASAWFSTYALCFGMEEGSSTIWKFTLQILCSLSVLPEGYGSPAHRCAVLP